MEKIYQVAGRRVKEERTRQKITQERLAELAGLSAAFIGQIERGDNRASLMTIQKIADALHIPASRIFIDVPSKKTDYKLSEQIEALLRDKSPRERAYAVELLKFVFAKRR